MENYEPNPIDTTSIELTEELENVMEKLAKNTHEVWAINRIEQGWTYGSERNDEKKETPCLVAYEELPEIEKDYDRNTAIETIKVLLALGYEIKKKDE